MATSSWVVIPATSLVGLLLFAVRARTTSLSPLSVLTRAELNGVAVLLVVALGVGWAVWGARAPRLLSDLTVAATATYVSGSLLLALAGTPWGLRGLASDEVFWTEGVTRFQHTLGSADHAYRGLPSHYPPLLAWLEGHVGVLLGVPGWEMVKYGQIAVSFLVPVLAYLLWRRVVAAPPAAAVVTVTTFLNADPHKVDEWLVLALVVPWWLDAFRGCRAPGRRPWPAWAHGVLAGLLLSTFTFYFLPLALATVAGTASDVARRRPWRPALLRHLVIVGVGLLVASWYWLPLVLARVRGLPTDTLQLRWFKEGLAGVPVLAGSLVTGLLILLGVVYLVGLAPRRARAEGVLLVALAGYVTIGLGLLADALNHPYLAFKANPLVLQALIVGGVLALFELAGWAGSWGRADRVVRAVAHRAVLGFLAVATLVGMLQFVDTWAHGDAVAAAHRTPLPDGSLPRWGGAGAPAPRGASVDDLRRALGPDASPSAVVATTMSGLVATTPVHLFTPQASIYSSPLGRFDARVAFLQRLAATRDPRRFTALARHNRFDAIDGFVLLRHGGSYTYRVHVDNYPRAWRAVVVRFHRSQFSPSDWRVTDLPGAVVVTAR